MSNDILIDLTTHDIDLISGSSLRLCESKQELIAQRVAITLKTFLGEWFANTLFGVPYFQTIYGKNTKVATDIVLQGKIQEVDGITELLSFTSTLDPITRKLSVSFKASCESGSIVEQEITV